MERPVAKDGSSFDRDTCRNGVYTVGEKGKERQFKDYEEALAFLREMAVAKWRRPNSTGHWGIVRAVRWASDDEIREGLRMDEADAIGGAELDDAFARIREAKTLRQLNDFLTKSMAQQKIQGVIKAENLDRVLDAVMALTASEAGTDESAALIGAAMLGRLAAVARARESVVFSRVPELLPQMPVSLEVLADGDEKYYAALSIQSAEAPWVQNYCCREAVALDTAEKARRVLLNAVLKRSGSLADFWQSLLEVDDAVLSAIDSNEGRYKRIRRVSSAANEVVRAWDGEVGDEAGPRLAEWLVRLYRSPFKGVEAEVLANILDDALSMLLRVVELRFSNALLAPTYSVLERARRSLGSDTWAAVIRESNNLEKMRTCLKEAALVLARQRRTDKDMMDALCSAYYSRAQVMPAVAAHFASAQELDPDIREWWEKAGVVKDSQRKAEHKVGNTEDQQIGSLLINVEDSKPVMDKLKSAVVPFLEISDPPLAETVKKVAASYHEIEIAARQLATMRRLRNMGLSGEIIEYNPMQHDMLGGHQLGVRTVRVERDGIQKDFGGKIKVLVKPRVIPEE